MLADLVDLLELRRFDSGTPPLQATAAPNNAKRNIRLENINGLPVYLCFSAGYPDGRGQYIRAPAVVKAATTL